MREENTVLFYNLPDEEFLEKSIDLSYSSDKSVLLLGDRGAVDSFYPVIRAKLKPATKIATFTQRKSLLKNFYLRSFDKVFSAFDDIPGPKVQELFHRLIRYQEPGTICVMVAPLYITETLLKGFFNGRYLVGHITIHNRTKAVVIAVRY
jgi:hypothetical protein